MSFSVSLSRRFSRAAITLIVALTSTALILGGLPSAAFAADEKSDHKSEKADKASDVPVDTDGDGELDRPDKASAMSTAVIQKKRVEDLSARTASTSMFANPDGSWTIDAYSGPVRAQDDKDKWVPVDPAVAAEDGAFVPKASPYEISFADGGDKTIASVTGENGKSIGLGWTDNLPAPIVAGDTLTYPDVADNGDLVVQSKPNGFSYSVVLDKAPAADADPVEIRYPLNLGGAKATLAADGSVEIKKGKTKIGSMSAPIMFDSSTSKKAPAATESNADEPAEPTPTASPTTTDGPTATEDEAAPTSDDAPADEPTSDADSATGTKADPKAIVTALEGDGDATTLVLRPDMGFLTDPSTVYPLTIDPTFVLSSAADTYIQSSGNTNSQLGSPELRVGSIDGGATVARSLVYFDLSGAPTLTPAEVTAATVTTSNFETGACAGTALTMSRITSGWDGAGVTWATQPSVTATGATQSSAAFGATGCATEGRISFDATQIYKDWAAGGPAVGVQIKANNENAASGFRKLRSAYNGDAAKTSKLSVTYNSTPSVPANSTLTPSADDGSSKVTSYKQPTFSATVSDPDGGNVTGEFKLVNASNAVVDSWTSGSVLSGTKLTRKPASALTEGSYTASWRTSDGTFTSAWSPGVAVKVDLTAPSFPTVSCPGLVNETWYDSRPSASVNCTVAANSDYARVTVWDGTNYSDLVPPSSGPTSVKLALPIDGLASLSITVWDKASNNTGANLLYGFGGGSLSSPKTGSGSVDKFMIAAVSKRGATSSQIQWREAGTAAWTPATKTMSGGMPWYDSAWNNGPMTSSSSSVEWSAIDEPGVKNPAVLDVRVCFSYSETPSQRCTGISTVNLAPHAFGGSFPTATVGPAEVSLISGEYQVDETDAVVPGYADALSLTRTYQSLGTPANPAQGVFGPGWVANLDGPSGGFATAQVLDDTADDGTITLLDSDGGASTYLAVGGGNVKQASVVYKGVSEASTFNEKLEIRDVKIDPNAPDGSPTRKRLELTEADGTVTKWALTEPNVWNVESVSDPSSAPATKYKYNGDYVTGIYAGIPGIACNADVQDVGCRALLLSYSTINNKQRLTKVELQTSNPEGTAQVTQTIREYAYFTDGLLQSSWDPRQNPAGTALKTTYDYNRVNGRWMLTGVQAPGQTGWRLNLGSDGVLDSVTRAQTAAVGGGAATWRIDYNVPLSGTNLPTVTPAATGSWGQPQAPDKAAAVFGPDAPDTTDPRYADITYWTKEGRTTNTASYGAGEWQIDSTGYTANGQVNWKLNNTGRKAGLDYGWDGPAIGFNLASLTEYSADGTRVEKTYGPFRNAILRDGSAAYVRPVTENDYDDEVAAALKPGAPTTALGPNDPKRNMLVVQRSGVYRSTGGELVDVDTTQYSYNKVVPTDGDGWTLKMPTRVSTSLNGGVSTTLTRFDTDGKTIETRTPQGVSDNDGAGSDGRSTVTKYYTVGANPADSDCGGKRQWVGEVCKVGPAGSSTAPTTTRANFDSMLNPTTITEKSGTGAAAMTRTTTSTYDAAGRRKSDETSMVGAPSGDQPVVTANYEYSPTTGLPTTTTSGSATSTTGYDVWGRVTSQTDGNGNTAATTYDAAGRVKTVDDGKGTYTYTYDGTDSRGKLERRGLVTKLDVGLASGPDEFTAAYDEQGNQVQLVYPNGIKADSTYDTAGTRTQLAYSRDGQAITSFANYADIDGRTKVEQSIMSLSYYTYDGRDRLTRATDLVWGQCTTRDYTFSLDSNRKKLEIYAPGSGGACTATSPTTKNSDFNGDDQITTAGYTYDNFGRTRTMPAADTDQPTGGAASMNYYANDMVAKISQQVPASGNVLEKSYGLDTTQRLSTMSSKTGGVELRKTVNHYSDGSDSPAWIEMQTRPDAATAWSTRWSRNVEGPDGDLGLIQLSDGTSRVQLTDMRGSIVATLPNTTAPYAGLENYSESDEYGNVKTGGFPLNQSYTWLGEDRRSTDTVAGLTLMGARLYNPTTGRFLSRDPVPGGNDNTYTYPVDPINIVDLDGRFGIPKFVKKNWRKGLKVAIGAAAIAGGIACGVSIACAVAVGAGAAAASYTAGSAGRKGANGFKVSKLLNATRKGALGGAVEAGLGGQASRILGKAKHVGNLKPFLRRPVQAQHKAPGRTRYGYYKGGRQR